MKPLAYAAALAMLSMSMALAQSPGTTSSSRPYNPGTRSTQAPPSTGKAIRQSRRKPNQTPTVHTISAGRNTSPQAKASSAESSSTALVQSRYVGKPTHTPDPGTQPNPLSLDRGNGDTAGQQPPKPAR
jgi:hypothetical protein